jgi:RNA recognition motif-containing protein
LTATHFSGESPSPIPERRGTIPAKIFVGNLNFKTTKDELVEVLAEAGRVVDVHLPTDRETGRPRGFAFVEFSNDAEAADAIRLFNGREVSGRKLNVNPADDRPRQPPRPRPAQAFIPGRPFSPAPPPSDDPFAPTDGGFDRGKRSLKPKGSRRGLRARKRSLNF